MLFSPPERLRVVMLLLTTLPVPSTTASRVSAETVRKLRAFLKGCYISIDYRDQEIKGFTLKEEGRQRTITQVPLDVTPYEPLRAELEAFVAACLGEEARYVDGREGRQALPSRPT